MIAMETLEKKVALVTGAAKGIGKTIALSLAKAGASVALTDKFLEGSAETCSEIEKMGHTAIAVQCDVSRGDEVTAMLKKVQEVFPSIHILVNNAGIARDGLLIRMDEDAWDSVLGVNLKGTFLMTKAVSQMMMQNRFGRIINIASVVGLMGNAGQSNYAASKAGVIALTKSVAKEFASRNITCNAIAPGFIETSMTERLPEKVRTEYMKGIPLARFGKPEDVANAVVFLASDDAAYITGQVISVDGGMMMR